MRTGHPALQAAAHRLGRQRLDMARHRIVRLVAMHVDPQAALRRELAELADGLGAIGHGALEMRDAADHVHAAIEGGDDPLGQRAGSRAGALEVLIGVAALQSSRTGTSVDIADLGGIGG